MWGRELSSTLESEDRISLYRFSNSASISLPKSKEAANPQTVLHSQTLMCNPVVFRHSQPTSKSVGDCNWVPRMT